MENTVTYFSKTARTVAAGATALLAVSLAGCAGNGDDAGEGGEVKGSTIRVTLVNHVWTDIARKKIDDFTAETGVKVVVTQLGEDQLSDQYNVKLNAGADDIDVLMYRPLQENKLFADNGYLADLTSRVTGDKEWNWDDFQDGPRSLTSYQDKVVGVPIITERQALYYRKDLLEKAGLEVPKTLDELKAAAEKISADNPGVAGFVARTARSAAVTQFSSFLYSFGGQWINDDGTSGIGSDAAREAYAYYGGLIHDFGPKNVSTDMSWSEAMAIFTQGGAAFYPEADSLYKNATDPANSKVSDTVGFAAFPAGPAGSKPYNVAAWALGVNEMSKNKDAAWEFVKWFSSAETALEIQKAGVPGPRTSVWENPEGVKDYPADLAAAIIENGKNGVGQDRPLVISVAEAREIVGDPIVVAITGGDVSGAIDKANTSFDAFLKEDGK